MVKRLALAVVFLLVALPPAGAFHELDCGPFRTTVIDKKTGERTCLAQPPEARRQYLRTKELQREQKKRTNDQQLLLRKRTARQDLQQEQNRRARELVLQ